MQARWRILLLLAVLAFLPAFTADSSWAQGPGPFVAPPRSVRSREFDEQHIRLELDFDWERRSFQGRALHTLVPFRLLEALEFDAAQMKVESVTLARGSTGEPSQPLMFTQQDGKLRVTLDRFYKPGETLQIAIQYRVERPRHGVHFVVPDADEPGQQRMVWTQSEPEFARYWFPCVDSPVEKVTSEIVATVPEPYFVLSNGSLVKKAANSDGTQTWHWRQADPHAPYLLSVVAGDFEVLEQSWNGIPVLSYVPRGRLADAARSFDKTPRMLQYFSERIGIAYPWPKYAQICVDEYEWGGMEHTSATTLNLNTLHDERAHLDRDSDNLVAHELAHQWWGDLLTCKDWGELWLNESFATYFATLWTEKDLGWDEAVWERHQEAQSYLDEDRRYRRPIVNYRYPSPLQMFDRHSYPKGGRVLHMLRHELGDELFWKAIRRYGELNRFRTVETADFRIAIEEATGQPMSRFFDQWLYHGGHPDFRVEWRWDEQEGVARVTIRQTQKVDDTTPLFDVPVELEFATGKEATLRSVHLTKAEETFSFELPHRPTRVCFDPQDWILKTVKFEKSKQELEDQLLNDEHLMCRVEAVRGLAAWIEDRDVVKALAKAAREDAFWAVREEAAKVLAQGKGDVVRQTLIAAAKQDAKSFVRRAALQALDDFSHDETRAALRQVIAEDPSYYAVADALRTLVKVDEKHAATDLLAALDRASDEEVILKAACDGLVQLKDTRAVAALQKLLEPPSAPERRVILIGAIARLRTQDDSAQEQLVAQLENERMSVRRAAMEALVAVGNPRAIEPLLKRREAEETPRMLRAVDEALDKLRAKERDLEGLQKQVEDLRRRNQQLEERLEKLEKRS